jgi:hypothetical protein
MQILQTTQISILVDVLNSLLSVSRDSTMLFTNFVTACGKALKMSSSRDEINCIGAVNFGSNALDPVTN